MNRCGFLWRSKTVSEDPWLAQMSVSLLWEGVDAVLGHGSSCLGMFFLPSQPFPSTQGHMGLCQQQDKPLTKAHLESAPCPRESLWTRLGWAQSMQVYSHKSPFSSWLFQHNTAKSWLAAPTHGSHKLLNVPLDQISYCKWNVKAPG